MIDVKELRIGNLIKCNCSICCGQSFAVEEIFSNSVLVDGPRIFCQDLEPIPLTPEILEQCGFDHIKLDKYANNFFTFRVGGLLVRNYDKAVMSVECKYLHQLQNLVYSLTGEELQVNIHDNAKEKI